MADNKIHITVPIEVKQAVFKKCAKRYQSVSEYIRSLIRKDLENDQG